MYYDLKKDVHLPTVSRDAITKRLLSSKAEILFEFVDRSTASQSRLWHTSIWGETDRLKVFYRDPEVDSSSSSYVNVDCPPPTHVDSRLFRGFSSQHFRLGLFVRFKGNLAQPKAIRSERWFRISSPSMKRPALLQPNPKSVSSRRIEGASQRRPDLHRLPGKVDPGFSSFESERHPVVIVNCIG